MKVKLTMSEIKSLEYALSIMLQTYIPRSYYHKLLLAVIQKLYVKIARALVVYQRNYVITLDEITALAFSELFDQEPFKPDGHAFNLMLQLSNEIKQKYA